MIPTLKLRKLRLWEGNSSEVTVSKWRSPDLNPDSFLSITRKEILITTNNTIGFMVEIQGVWRSPMTSISRKLQVSVAKWVPDTWGLYTGSCYAWVIRKGIESWLWHPLSPTEVQQCKNPSVCQGSQYSQKRGSGKHINSGGSLQS